MYMNLRRALFSQLHHRFRGVVEDERPVAYWHTWTARLAFVIIFEVMSCYVYIHVHVCVYIYMYVRVSRL